MREIGEIIREAEARKREPLALATLVRTHGSAYRRTGARMLIDRAGRLTGSISAGCVEEEIAERSRTVLQTGRPAWMSFDTRRRFGCNGTIEVFIEQLKPKLISDLAQRRRQRISTTVATVFSQGSFETGTRMAEKEFAFPFETLIQRIDPPIRLIVLGDGPENAAMRTFAAAMGWTFIDAAHVPELVDGLDEWTAVVVKTHNYGRDFAALQMLLKQDLPYVGLVGSRGRRERLIADLLDTGVEIPDEFHSPAGLDLQCDSPESIALSIITEIQAVIAGGTAQPLSEQCGPIHRRETDCRVIA